jgi:hypothetical protein
VVYLHSWFCLSVWLWFFGKLIDLLEPLGTDGFHASRLQTERYLMAAKSPLLTLNSKAIEAHHKLCIAGQTDRGAVCCRQRATAATRSLRQQR